MSERPTWLEEGPDGLQCEVYVDRTLQWGVVAAALAGTAAVVGPLAWLGASGLGLAVGAAFGFGTSAVGAFYWTMGKATLRIDDAVVASVVRARGRVVSQEQWALHDVAEVHRIPDGRHGWRLRLVHRSGVVWDPPMVVSEDDASMDWLRDRIEELASQARPLADPTEAERRARQALETVRHRS